MSELFGISKKIQCLKISNKFKKFKKSPNPNSKNELLGGGEIRTQGSKISQRGQGNVIDRRLRGARRSNNLIRGLKVRHYAAVRTPKIY